jgi:hypothetical protein
MKQYGPAGLPVAIKRDLAVSTRDCLVALVPSIGGRRRWNGLAKAPDSATVGAFFVGISQ